MWTTTRLYLRREKLATRNVVTQDVESEKLCKPSTYTSELQQHLLHWMEFRHLIFCHLKVQ